MKRKVNGISSIIIPVLLIALIGLVAEQRMSMSNRADKQDARMDRLEVGINDIRDRYNLIIVNTTDIQSLKQEMNRFEAKLDRLLER